MSLNHLFCYLVMAFQELSPSLIALFNGALCRSNNVSKENSGKHSFGIN